jgi:hypothetical protein
MQQQATKKYYKHGNNNKQHRRDALVWLWQVLVPHRMTIDIGPFEHTSHFSAVQYNYN